MAREKFSGMTDEELILELQETNTVEAFEELAARYKNPLMNFVYRFLGDYESCTDVVQETMIRVYNNRNSYRSIAKFSTWIYTIAGNLAKTELSKRKRRNVFSIFSLGGENKHYEIPDLSSRPDYLLESEWNEKVIQDSLLKIKPVYREVLILRDVQELTYEEIAEITGLNIGTVKSRINRGRAQLKQLLKKYFKE